MRQFRFYGYVIAGVLILTGLLLLGSRIGNTEERFTITVLTNSDTLYLIDAHGEQVGSFTLPATEPITLTIQRKRK